MPSSKFSFVNYTVLFLLSFAIVVYLLLLQVHHLHCNQKSSDTDNGEIVLNGFKLSDLKNMPPMPFPMGLPPTPPDERNTLQFPMFTFTSSGGLGQMLFELAALLGLSRTLERVPILNPLKDWKIIDRFNSHIRKGFPEFAEQFEEKHVQLTEAFSLNFNIRTCCKFENPLMLKSLLIQQHVILNGVYFQSFKYFDQYKSELQELLKPTPESLIRAEAIIPEEYRQSFIICVHTKQPSFGETSLSKPSDPIFTRSATDYLVEKYQKLGKSVAVAVLGNDPLWARDVFQGDIVCTVSDTEYDEKLHIHKIGKSKVFISKSTIPNQTPNYTTILTLGWNPEDDMAFSQNFCSVILLSAPTSQFGWWMAYLMKGGTRVYYRDPKEVRDQIFLEMNESDYFPETWRKLKGSSLYRREKQTKS